MIPLCKERLLETLNNILKISKIEAEKVEYELNQYDLVPILKDVIELYYPTAKFSNIDLHFDCQVDSLQSLIDPHLFRDAISNLISNAIKFTEEGSVVLVLKEVNEKAIVEVIDTGIGIPDDRKEIIWEAFRQVSEGLGRGFEGTGLGLTIAKKYIDLLKGKIFLESKEGEGSVFTIELDKIKNTI